MRTDRFVVGVSSVVGSRLHRERRWSIRGRAQGRLVGCIETGGISETRRDFELRNGPCRATEIRVGMAARRFFWPSGPGRSRWSARACRSQLVPEAQPVLLVLADRRARGPAGPAGGIGPAGPAGPGRAPPRPFPARQARRAPPPPFPARQARRVRTAGPAGPAGPAGRPVHQAPAAPRATVVAAEADSTGVTAVCATGGHVVGGGIRHWRRHHGRQRVEPPEQLPVGRQRHRGRARIDESSRLDREVLPGEPGQLRVVLCVPN